MYVQIHYSHKYTLESTTPRYAQASDAEEVTINGHTPPPAIHKHTPTHAIWPKGKKTVDASRLRQCKSVPDGLNMS